MLCDGCGSDRVFDWCGKSGDQNEWKYKGAEHTGALPQVLNVCKGDSFWPIVCLSCGKVQGDFPVPDPK